MKYAAVGLFAFGVGMFLGILDSNHQPDPTTTTTEVLAAIESLRQEEAQHHVVLSQLCGPMVIYESGPAPTDGGVE